MSEQGDENVAQTEWNSDTELFELARGELYTAVIGDICDQLDLRKQFLSPGIRPMQVGPEVPLMIGRAMTVLEADVFADPRTGPPFGKMLDALDDLKPGEVYVCAGASPRYALVGELMATAMIARGAVGAVCEGYVRDTEGILKLGFPVYSYGSYSQDQRGRGIVLDWRVPLEISGVRLNSGDIVVGDIDGVLVVPREVEERVFTDALAKARAEKTVQKAIANGMTATAAFEEYGIL
jgi:regulator of RNase E activity RraA